MVRAATPWVHAWREPILAFAEENLPLSGYAAHYVKATDQFTVDMARWQAEDYGSYLFVIQDGSLEKGTERWTTAAGSRRADELFGVLTIAHRQTSGLGEAVFRTSNPLHMMSLAQGMIYNANPQDPARLGPNGVAGDWQPIVGWDTLNWDPAVRVPELRAGVQSSTTPISTPRIRLNWRAKLTPVTLADEAAGSPTNDLFKRINNTPADRLFLNTH